MNVSYYEFWKTTWMAWKMGELETVSSNYYQVADKEFDDFLKSSEDAKNPNARKFFTANPPNKGEFLIVFFGDHPDTVMTNQRLWMYDKRTKELVNFDLKDITEYYLKENWN